MENSQIWLKPKPTHIDEYFSDFLNYIRQQTEHDALYNESIRLLVQRVDILLDERFSTPVYRQPKDADSLWFTLRLCGAWMLCVKNCSYDKRKLVFLTMLNSVIQLSLLSNASSSLNTTTLASKSVPDLMKMAISVMSHKLPERDLFTWGDLMASSIDIFLINFMNNKFDTVENGYFDGRGTIYAKGGELILSSFQKSQVDETFLKSSMSRNRFLPDYGISIFADKNNVIKESQKDDVDVIEKFVDTLREDQKNSKKAVITHRLSDYEDGETASVEIVEISITHIMVETIDPDYNEVKGQLIFESTLKISKIYPAEVWKKVLRVGDRIKAKINVHNATFSVMDDFIDYLNDIAEFDYLYDAHNHRVNDQLNLREFWTTHGFMVYINLSEDEDQGLREHDDFAVISIDRHGEKGFRGCIYGSIVSFDVDDKEIDREKDCPNMLKKFIDTIRVETKEQSADGTLIISKNMMKELALTLHIIQSHETNPILRYRWLSALRIVSFIADCTDDELYSTYIAKYIKTLITFAQADTDEGKAIIPIAVPDDLADEETISNGTDILTILSCFAKDYDATSDILDPFIESDNETLSKTASLVQSYNRLYDILELKTLRGIKKQILNSLSVVTGGDSNLELSNELEGIFGEEDDMKEFKVSFFVAPKNAPEQRQFHTIFRGICAMMNNRGGTLYLGVNDKGIPVGLDADLEILKRQTKFNASLDGLMLHISRLGEGWFGEKIWKYVTLKPIAEHNVVSIVVEPYPYDIVFLKDGTTYLRKNNSSAPLLDQATIDDIRRRRLEALRKSDDKTIIIKDAIQKQHKVRLIGYSSSSSGTIKNRVVEPFEINENEYITCYEAETDMVKTFRLSRAERIVVLDDAWTHTDKHRPLQVDAFHMSGDEKITVRLKLKLQAKNALDENYPALKDSIRQVNKDTWQLTTYAYSLIPVMMFYITHAEYITIVEAPGLLQLVHEYINKNIPKT